MQLRCEHQTITQNEKEDSYFQIRSYLTPIMEDYSNSKSKTTRQVPGQPIHSGCTNGQKQGLYMPFVIEKLPPTGFVDNQLTMIIERLSTKSGGIWTNFSKN